MGIPNLKWKVRKYTDGNQDLNRQVLKIRQSWGEVEKLLKDKKKEKK